MADDEPAPTLSPGGAVSPGAAIRLVRRLLHKDDKGRHVSQEALYEACEKLESSWPEAARTRTFGRVTAEGYAKAKIRAIEQGQTVLGRIDLEIVAAAFRLPRHFFTTSYASEDEVRQAYERGRLTERTPPGEPAPRPARMASGFRRTAQDSVLPEPRTELAAQLLERLRRDPSSLVLVEGRTGVGKSYFLGHWFRQYGHELFGGDAISIDCTDRSADNILPAIAEHLHLASRAENPASLASEIATLPRYLVVLDGLRASNFFGRTSPNHVSLSSLREGLLALVGATRNMALVLCVENNAGPLSEQRFVDEIPDSVAFHHLEIRPLSDDEGAAFLAALGRTSMPAKLRRQVSQQLQGMPLALLVAATELDGLSDEERERYVDWLPYGLSTPQADDNFEQFKRLVESYLRRLDGVARGPGPADQASGHVLLRLLSIMPGPTTLTQLDELLRDGHVSKLAGFKVEQLRLVNLPFLIPIDDAIDVHALARRIFRGEVDAYIDNDKFDSLTSREELEWIHWKCAQIHWRVIRRFRGETDADGLGAGVIEAFVYHILQLIRLVPSPRRRSSLSGGLQRGVLERFEAGAGTLTNTDLWELAHSVVRDFMLERRFTSTRLYGLYDVKARVLENLARAAKAGVPIPPAALGEIEKEISVCLMHGGHINSARRAAEAASTSFQQVKRRSTAEVWRQLCEIEGVVATVEVRMGRDAGLVSERLAALLPQAKAFAAQPIEGGPIGFYAPPGPAGALRIFSRLADVELQMGRVGAALERFGAADELQHRLRQRRLDGEAARKYALALVRSRNSSNGHLEIAAELVRENIAHLNAVHGAANPSSSDLIPFLIQDAAVSRIAGHLDLAQTKFDEIRNQELVLRNAYTFATGIELDMEELRLSIAVAHAERRRLWEDEALVDRAGALVRRLEDSHHHLASWEAEILKAEVVKPEQRGALLTPVAERLRRYGWHLRLEDVAAIRKGESAVLRFGL